MNDNKMTNREQRATWGLGAVFSLRMLGMFMVLPVLATWGKTLQDANESRIGLAIGIYGLAQAVFQVPFGLLSDKTGRKPLIVGGLLMFILGSIIAASTHSIWGIISGRALQGAGAISAAVMALLSDLTREQNRTKAMAFIGISFGITFAIAMVTGPVVTHLYGLHALFALMAMLGGIAICVTVWLVPDASNHFRNRESGLIKDNLWDVLTNHHLLRLNTGILCLHILLMSGFIALPGLLERAGLRAEQHWKIYLTTMLVSFVLIMPVILYAEVKRRMRRVFICCVALLMSAEIVQWGAGSDLYLLILGVQLFFLAFNLLEALLPSLISKESPAGYKGTAMGIYSTCQFIGVAIGGSCGGWLLQHIDAQAVFFFCVLIAAVWLVISATMHEPPYVSSLRIELPAAVSGLPDLARQLQSHPGVSSVLVVPQEQSAYLKIDTKITSRSDLEQLISSRLRATASVG